MLIKKITNWFQNNNLLINKEKTVSLYFRHLQNNNDNVPVVNFDNKNIPLQTEAKFLGVTVNHNLKWNSHIELLSKKLSKVCFLLRQTRETVNKQVLRTFYYSNFHSLLLYGILFWGNSSSAKTIFTIQKRAIRLIVNINSRTSCIQYFKEIRILPLPCVYVLELLNYIKTNLHQFNTVSQVHSHNTRNKNNLARQTHKSKLFEDSFVYTGLIIYNKLPLTFRNNNVQNFKIKLKKFLLQHCFYTLDEFIENCNKF